MYDLDKGDFVEGIEFSPFQEQVYQNKVYCEKYVAIGLTKKLCVIDIVKKCQIKMIDTKSIYIPYGFDVISFSDRNICLMGGKSGCFLCTHLESSEILYSGRIRSEARNIFGMEDQKNLFCVGCRDEIQIHDLNRKKCIRSSSSIDLKGYILGLVDSTVHNIIAAGFHYKKFVALVDRKNMSVIGKSEKVKYLGTFWNMEKIDDRIYVSTSEGKIIVFDIKKYNQPLYSVDINKKRKKIYKLQRIGDGNLFGVSGDFSEVYIYESKTRFSDSRNWKRKYRWDLNKHKKGAGKGDTTVYNIWGQSSNFSSISKNLEMDKMDKNERIQYLMDEYLEEKKYYRRIKLDNTTISVFIFNLVQ